MPFDLKGKGSIRSVSITRGSKDSQEVSATLGVLVERQPAASVAGVLGAEGVGDVIAAFHADPVDDPDRNVAFLNIASIKSRAKFTGKHTFKIGGFEVRAEKVASISVAPEARGVWTVQAAVTVADPPAGMLELVAELLHDETDIELRQDEELPLEGGGRAKAGGKKSQRGFDRLAGFAGLEGVESVEVVGADGETLATFGKGAR